MAAPSSTSTRPAGSQSNVALLTDPTFGPYFGGNLLSNAGNWIQNVSAATAVFNLTGSAALTGVVSGALWVGSLVLQPYVGALSDRVNRRWLFMVGQSLSFVAAAVLGVWSLAVGLEGLPGPWLIIAATLVIGVGQAIAIPPAQALVPSLVDEQHLEGAIALNSITYTLGRSLGPVAAAGILYVGGPELGFATNAVTFLPLIIVLALIRPRDVDTAGTGDGSVREGVRYVRATAGLLGVMAVVTAIGWTSDPINTLAPSVADRLGGGDPLVGLFVGSFGVGAAIAGTLVTRVRQKVGADRLARGGLALFGAGVAAFGWAPSAVIGCASLVIAGTGFLAALTSITTWVQRTVPEELRGRVMALWGVAFLGCRPFAAVIDGALADLLTPATAVTIAALPVLIGAAFLPTLEGGAPDDEE